MDAFRTKKETMKATYTAAEAQTKIGEAVSGISESMSDAGMSMQRAQDKIDGMQARAGAMDELLASGALTDLSNPVDDIQAQLNKASTTSTVDAELAALKAEVGTGAPPRPSSDRRSTRTHRRDRPHPGRGAVLDPRRGAERARGAGSTVAEAVDSGNATAFAPALAALTAAVRRLGTPLADDDFAPSDLVVPFPDATLEETKGLLADSADGSGSRRALRLDPMSTARNIPSDRGLTLRMFTTGLMLVILYGAVIGLLIAFGISYSVVLVLRGRHPLRPVLVLGQDRPVRHGRPGRHPRAGAAAARRHRPALCALADMKKPRVAIADTDVPNAFATGRSPNSAVVCATTGLMRRLDESELEAVLSHELSHVAHRDVAVMTIASFLGMVAGMITRIMLWTGLMGGFGGGNRGNNQGGNDNAALVELGVLVVSVVVYAISFLLTMALSRYRELAADRSGALLTGRPSALASALVKVTGEMSRIPTRDLRSSESFNAFYFTPAIAKSGVSLSTIFSTHPSLEKRLAQLATHRGRVGPAFVNGLGW